MVLMDIKEVSAWLNLKPSTLYLWVAQGTIPYLKLGRLLRFHPEAIEAWLQDHSREPVQETALPECHSSTGSVDDLIAEAKRSVYTPCHGKSDQNRATRKGEHRGTV